MGALLVATDGNWLKSTADVMQDSTSSLWEF